MNELRNQVQPQGRHEEDSVNLMIGKVASLYDITVQTLRHYDKIDLFRPEVVSEETGYRYYSVFQLRQLEYILFLRGLGLSLSEIKTILDRLRHDESWSDVLQVHLAAVQDQIAALQAQQEIMQRLAAGPLKPDTPLETVTVEKITPMRHYLLREIPPLAVTDRAFTLRLIEARKGLLGKIPSVQTSYSFGALVSLSDFRKDRALRYRGILMDPGPYHTRPPLGSVGFPEGYYAAIRFDRAECQPEHAYELLDRFLTEHRFQSDDRILEVGLDTGFSSISRISRITELMVQIEL